MAPRRRQRAEAAFLVLGAVATSCGRNTPGSPGAVALGACSIDGYVAWCGSFEVPEDRSEPHGKRFSLRVVVLAATSAVRQPDPIIYVAGGPGGAATDMIPTEAVVGGSLNVHRGLVFIDQRGAGGSYPLMCPPPPLPGVAHAAALAACMSSGLAGLSGDIRFYTTAAAADDTNDALTALGYGQVNITGGFLRRDRHSGVPAAPPDRVRTARLSGGTLFEGSFDPQDPPATMADAFRLWPNSMLLTEPGQSHGISSWSCRQAIITAFVERGTTRGLDANCLNSVTPPPFVLTP